MRDPIQEGFWSLMCDEKPVCVNDELEDIFGDPCITVSGTPPKYEGDLGTVTIQYDIGEALIKRGVDAFIQKLYWYRISG